MATAVTLALVAAPASGALAAGASAKPAAPSSRSSSQRSCDPASRQWPMYQATSAHAAAACSDITSSNASTLEPTWFVQTPGTVTATPIVYNGTLYVGDSTGAFYALDQGTGAKRWTTDLAASQTCFLDATNPHTDHHRPGFGEITSSATVVSLEGIPTLFVGAGGSLFALDPDSGRCLWAQDLDPATPTSVVEVESSPVVDESVNPPEVIVGDDVNDSNGVALTGVTAFNAVTGALVWKYVPERDVTLTPAEFGGSDAMTLSCGDGADNPDCNPTHIPGLSPNSVTYSDGCGDVWSSPALDPTFVDPAGDNTFEGSAPQPKDWQPKRVTSSGHRSADGLVTFATANCSANSSPASAAAHGDYVDNQAVFALDPVTGVRVWSFVEPYNIYDADASEPGGGDDDFGSSPLLTRVPGTGCPGADLVIEGSKSGYAYGLCEATGKEVWVDQIAQPGQLSEDSVGSLGGIIGSPALGTTDGRPTVYFTSAIPLPFSNDGLRVPGDGDNNISHCPGLAELPLLPVCPDLTLLSNPLRLMSLHAVDAATGRVAWNAVSLPSYGAATYTNGVVFDPETFGFSAAAYSADTGLPLWVFPLGGAPSSGVAISGSSIFLGAGNNVENLDGEVFPPQLLGIWSFSLPSLNLAKGRLS